MKKINWRLLKKLIPVAVGIASMLGYSIVVLWTFIKAYFNNYEIKVFINHFGEAQVEFVFIPITILISFYTSIVVSKVYIDKVVREIDGSNKT